MLYSDARLMTSEMNVMDAMDMMVMMDMTPGDFNIAIHNYIKPDCIALGLGRFSFSCLMCARTGRSCPNAQSST